MGRKRNKIADIAVSTRHMVNYSAYAFTFRKRQVVAANAETVKVSVQVCLDKRRRFVVKFFTSGIEHFYSVVVIRVMRSGYHYTAVKAVLTGHKRNTGSCDNVQYICVGARRGQACGKSVFEHITRTAGIFSYDNARAVIRSVKTRQRG